MQENNITACPDYRKALESASAAFGIDIENAQTEKLFIRMLDGINEFKDCYEPDSTEHEMLNDICVAISWLYSKIAPINEIVGASDAV